MTFHAFRKTRRILIKTRVLNRLGEKSTLTVCACRPQLNQSQIIVLTAILFVCNNLF